MQLADTSAWTNRSKDALVDARFAEAIRGGEIATCGPVVMELLWTTRSLAEFVARRDALGALPDVAVTENVWHRAADVWERLCKRGRHRQVPWPDLVVAAAAELAGLAVCHYDRHFEIIAEVTGQPMRAIAPLGTL